MNQVRVRKRKGLRHQWEWKGAIDKTNGIKKSQKSSVQSIYPWKFWLEGNFTTLQIKYSTRYLNLSTGPVRPLNIGYFWCNSFWRFSLVVKRLEINISISEDAKNKKGDERKKYYIRGVQVKCWVRQIYWMGSNRICLWYSLNLYE